MYELNLVYTKMKIIKMLSYSDLSQLYVDDTVSRRGRDQKQTVVC